MAEELQEKKDLFIKALGTFCLIKQNFFNYRMPKKKYKQTVMYYVFLKIMENNKVKQLMNDPSLAWSYQEHLLYLTLNFCFLVTICLSTDKT